MRLPSLFTAVALAAMTPSTWSGEAAGNLLLNPDLTRIDGELPAHWSLTEVTDPENYTVTVRQNILGVPSSVQFVTTMAETSRYLTQVVKLEPGASYEWRAKVYQNGGRGFMWVKAVKDLKGEQISWQRYIFLNSYIGHPLYPDFASARQMRGAGVAGWRTETVRFDLPENLSEVRFSIGVYFSNADLNIGPMSLHKLPAKP